MHEILTAVPVSIATSNYDLSVKNILGCEHRDMAFKSIFISDTTSSLWERL